MKKTLFICLIVLIGFRPSIANSQTDSVESVKSGLSKIYFAYGGGFCLKGIILGMSFNKVFPNEWGWSISFNSNIYKSSNTPADYYSDGLRTFAPKDYLSFISLNLIKEFATSRKGFRFGFEGGPAFIRYSLAEFKINNNSTSFFNTGTYKYIKSHRRSNTVGLTLRAKTKFPLGNSVGCELAAVTNLNNLHSMIGLEFFMYFGNTRE